MKNFSTRLRHFNTKFLWKEIREETGEIIGETFNGKELAIANLSEEYSADVDAVLKKEKPKNFIRRSYEKMKNFFKTKVLNVAELFSSAEESEGSLANLSTGQIKESYLYQTDDVFMLWACIEKLIDRSDFVLRDSNLLKTINRVAGREVFAADDYKNLSNEDFSEKFYDWVRGTPQLGEKKAELWTEKFIAENMAMADEDYAAEARNVVKNKEEFVGTISEYFSDFANQENLAQVDKGYILSFLRLAIKEQRFSENLRKQLLIHGAAIGFLTESDLVKIAEDFSGNDLWLNKLGKSSFEDCKQWSAEINNGKIPNTAKEFATENEEVVSAIFSEKSKVEDLDIEDEDAAPKLEMVGSESKITESEKAELPMAA